MMISLAHGHGRRGSRWQGRLSDADSRDGTPCGPASEPPPRRSFVQVCRRDGLPVCHVTFEVLADRSRGDPAQAVTVTDGIPEAGARGGSVYRCCRSFTPLARPWVGTSDVTRDKTLALARRSVWWPANASRSTNLRYQDTSDWRKWTKGGWDFPFSSCPRSFEKIEKAVMDSEFGPGP